MKTTIIAFILLIGLFYSCKKDNNISNDKNNTLDIGLIGYYPFNENAKDESGNGNDGSVTGAALTSDRFGNKNSAYSFNGNTDYIIFPNNMDILTRSIVLWFYAEENDYTMLYRSIFQSDNPYLKYGNSGVALIDINGQKKLLMTISGVTDTTDVITNKWNSIAIVLYGNKTIRYYYNGILTGSKVFSNYIQSEVGLDNIIIGANRNSNNMYFSGKIDDIRIYSRAISDSEVKEIINLKQ